MGAGGGGMAARTARRRATIVALLVGTVTAVMPLPAASAAVADGPYRCEARFFADYLAGAWPRH